jgi:hypothetical protein
VQYLSREVRAPSDAAAPGKARLPQGRVASQPFELPSHVPSLEDKDRLVVGYEDFVPCEAEDRGVEGRALLHEFPCLRKPAFPDRQDHRHLLGRVGMLVCKCEAFRVLAADEDVKRATERARRRDYDRAITTRRILYWLAAMVVLLIVGTSIGLVWADTSNIAGAFAGVTNIISIVGIVVLVIALAVNLRRRGRLS